MQKVNITCPECKNIQVIEIYTDRCLPFYKCGECNKVISAKKGSCCVICDYSDYRCPVSNVKE